VWEDDPCKDDGLPLADAGEEFPENTIIHVNCRDYKVIEEAKAAKAAGDSCVLFDNRVDTYDPINKIAVERDGPHPLAHTLKPGDIGNRAPHVPPPTTTGGDAAASAAGGGRPWDGIAEGERDVALLFPGQGAQAVGMGAALADSGVPGIAELFSTASKILGYDLLKLCKEGPMEKLSMTMYSQPAIFTVSMASILKLQHEKPETLKRARLVRRAIRRRAIRRRAILARNSAQLRARARFSSDAPRRRLPQAAGFSLGEYTALVYAGALSFEDGMKVVKARAEAMHAAAQQGGGSGMASVAGLDDPGMKKLIAEASKAVGGGKEAYIANYLFPGGRTLSGDIDVLDWICANAAARGAKNAKRLEVSGAFHSPYMKPAQEALSAVLGEAKISMPSLTVYSNVTGLPYESAEQIRALLERQMTESVMWEQSVRHMMRAECKEYVETGPGKQLKAMMRRIDNDVWQKTEVLNV